MLDADSSQRNAIDTVLAGRSLVIHGPPGTGKSQTIANLIAALVARGRKVLFVAEKRAAIDAVLSRLKGAAWARSCSTSTKAPGTGCGSPGTWATRWTRRSGTPEPDVGDLHRRLADRQRRLQPARVCAAPGAPALGADPVPGPVRAARHAERGARQRSGSTTPSRSTGNGPTGSATSSASSPTWAGSRSGRTARRGSARRCAPPRTPGRRASWRSRLSSRSLPMLVTGRPGPARRSACGRRAATPDAAATMRLFAGIAGDAAGARPGVYAADPARLAAADRRRRRAGLPRAPGAAQAGPRTALVPTGARAACRRSWPRRWPRPPAQLAQWQELRADDGLPRLPARLDELARACGGLRARSSTALRAYRPAAGGPASRCSRSWPPIRTRRGSCRGCTSWAAGSATWASARCWTSLPAARPALTWPRQHSTTPGTPSILDQMRVLDPRYAADRGDALDEIAGDFRVHDIQHLTANRGPGAPGVGAAAARGQDRHPLQARVIRKQAALRRGHLPLRRLLDQASDVLFAIKPCWAMSPLMVSQVLPAARLFDVVIFDEASQIVPADAIPAIMRGHQIVVAGDDRQLPPTNFFRQVGDADDDESPTDDESLVSFGAGFESVLDALRPLLPTAPLAWHYRSRDERLVAFSNTPDLRRRADHVPRRVPRRLPAPRRGRPGPGPGQEVSVDAEVEQGRRADPGARARAAGGVARRDRARHQARRADRRGAARLRPGRRSASLEAFFAEDCAEPFFVKNLERVQGDERDAIILSIGYGKHPTAGCATSGGRCCATAASAG